MKFKCYHMQFSTILSKGLEILPCGKYITNIYIIRLPTYMWHTWLDCIAGLILGLRPANERRRYFVTMSLIGWTQAWNRIAGLILGLHPANERQCYFVTTSLIGWTQA